MDKPTNHVAWQPIDMTTPEKWRGFYARQIGKSSFGVGAAFCPTALYVGIELITGDCRGIAFCIGPFWIGFVALRRPQP